ncbi:MAG: outer membrane protein assembly factor BamA [Rickettsiales bacterium]
MRIFVPALVCLSLLSSTALADTKISKVEYLGNQRITKETIFAYLEVIPGEKLTQEKLDASVKALFGTGYFSDVKIAVKGTTLIVELKENPLINKIAFEGNKKLEDDDLMKELSMKPYTVFSLSKMQSDLTRITQIYQKKGLYSVKIEPKKIVLDENRINLVYEIEEGKFAKIKEINFDGNKNFSDSELAETIVSREERWYRFFTSADLYDPDKMDYDREMIRRLYLNHGYADFKVTAATAEISPDRDSFLLTFVMEEGLKYNFGNFKVESEITKLDTEKLAEQITIQTGSLYTKEDIDKSIDNITNYLGNHGYPFVDVQAMTYTHPETQLADVTFRIKEGYKVYIRNINIKKNTRTLDKVIRREFRIAEGDPYNVSKIQRTKQRIDNLGFFNKVEFKNVRTDEFDKMDIDVEVEETSTGSMNFAAGYNTSSGALGSVSLSENNFLGKGQKVSLSYMLAQLQSNITFSFTEPYLFDKNLSGGFDVFKTKSEYKRDSGYSTSILGFGLRIGYDMTEHLSHGMRFTLKTEDVTDVAQNASMFIMSQAGKNTVSAVGQTFAYDRLNNRIEPTDGYFLKLDQDVAGIGGKSRYVQHEFLGVYYKPLYKDDVIFKLLGRAGNIFGYGGKKVRLSDRYSVGPDMLRGFDSAGIGPRDKKTLEALGGNSYYSGQAEIQFPLGLPSEVGVKGAVFTDFGALFGLDEQNKSGIYQSNSIRASSGASIIWKSPMGLLSVHYGVPWRKESFDDIRKFYFNFGTKF